ncbi:unnamed protein product [Adineta ricciae]|uniref:Kinesin-like protein n=1 Tax=Adineta ricciae TaxID=249248 RepID=A0A815FXB1_ADIRI|nr:unnamed protein product [Adineta ricciae]
MAASNTGEAVRVIVRCRPMNQRELDLACRTVITMNTQLNQVLLETIDERNEPPKQFTFDAVYPENSNTETLYTDSVFPLVESVLEGYNATVFAYGQTGCGKSFTMQGMNTTGPLQRGVIPRSFEHIFEASSVTAGTKYLIRASYLEIYNESIRDLLSKDAKAVLELKEHVDKGVFVPNLTWHQCISVKDCERLMDKGNKNRATGATLMNKDSSRSHSIFTIMTEMCTQSELDGKEHIRAGKLNLVDLAGSERQSKTHAEGDRLREATRINLSLSALGNVISALVDGRSKHIPYRDSKLTRLLQDSLGGNTKTLMIAAISPAHDNYEETLSTLRYANRAKNIKNKPHINEDPRDAQMRILQEEINRLKQELLDAGNMNRETQSFSSDGRGSQIKYDEEIEKEKERLRTEFEREAAELRRQCEEERLTNQELQHRYNDLKEQYDGDINALNKQTAPSKEKKKGRSGKQSSDENDRTPRAMNSEEKLKRLYELEHKLIGGEEINNEEQKKKRKKRLNEMREKQEQRKLLTKAIESNDDDVMMRVFDNAQEELHFTSKQLEQLRLENKRLKQDNEDLLHEFESDRQNYFNIMRAQEKQLLLFRTMLEKMSNVMERNCNYSNLDKIIEKARYDEERNVYYVPDPIREEVQFPQVANLPLSGSNRNAQNDFHSPSPLNYNYQNQFANLDPDEVERRYARNTDPSTVPLNTTRNKRQEQLLNENALFQSIKIHPSQTNDNDYFTRRLSPYESPIPRLTRRYGPSADK